jgi:hypothetical protein
MKWIFILLILILTSCGSNKQVVNFIINDSPFGQTDFDELNEGNGSTPPRRNEIIIHNSGGNSQTNDERVLSVEEPKVDQLVRNIEDFGNGSQKTKNLTDRKKKIVDLTDDSQISNPKEGIMAYSLPTEMRVGKSYNIKLRISKEKDKIKLIRNNSSNNLQTDTNYSITIESVRVEPLMTAELFGDKKAFEINPVSTELQNIEDKGYTEWEWQVIPIKSGIRFLKLIVRVRVHVEDVITFKDITVFDRNIRVKSNIGYVSSNFITEYWQWLMTTIIIPLIIWFWNRKNKKRNSLNS